LLGEYSRPSVFELKIIDSRYDDDYDNKRISSYYFFANDEERLRYFIEGLKSLDLKSSYDEAEPAGGPRGDHESRNRKTLAVLDNLSFMVKSYSQFKSVYDNFATVYPQLISEIVPFLQVSVDGIDSSQAYEFDFIGNQGLCRFEQLTNKSIRKKQIGNDFSDYQCDVVANRNNPGRSYSYDYYAKNVESSISELEKNCRKRRYDDGYYIYVNTEEGKIWEEKQIVQKTAYNLFKLMEKKDGNITPQELLTLILDEIANEEDQFVVENGEKCLDSAVFPEFPLCKADALSLPKSLYFKNCTDNYEEEKAGYTYYCNETSYETMKIQFRYGMVRMEDCMKNIAPLTSLFKN